MLQITTTPRSALSWDRQEARMSEKSGQAIVMTSGMEARQGVLDVKTRDLVNASEGHADAQYANPGVTDTLETKLLAWRVLVAPKHQQVWEHEAASSSEHAVARWRRCVRRTLKSCPSFSA